MIYSKAQIIAAFGRAVAGGITDHDQAVRAVAQSMCLPDETVGAVVGHITPEAACPVEVRVTFNPAYFPEVADA